jgi:hypothetical protein
MRDRLRLRGIIPDEYQNLLSAVAKRCSFSRHSLAFFTRASW